MDAVIASIIVSAIAGLATWMASRQNAKANTTNANTSGRVEMEKEAYERARKLDTETINRQKADHDELEEKYDKLKDRYDILEEKAQKAIDDAARMTHDNYQLHRENTRVIEINEQLLAENQRLRKQGEILMAELNDLRERVLATFPLQRGDEHSPLERGPNTDPMMPEVSNG